MPKIDKSAIEFHLIHRLRTLSLSRVRFSQNRTNRYKIPGVFITHLARLIEADSYYLYLYARDGTLSLIKSGPKVQKPPHSIPRTVYNHQLNGLVSYWSKSNNFRLIRLYDKNREIFD